MKFKTKLVNVLLLNIFTCAALCITAQLLAIAHGSTDHFSYSRFFLNFCVAYPVAGIVGMLVPSVVFGQWVCTKLNVKPSAIYGILMNACINLIFTVILSSVMTLLNVVILGKQGFIPFFVSLIGDFVPMWLVSCVISGLITTPIMNLACRLTQNKTNQGN